MEDQLKARIAELEREAGEFKADAEKRIEKFKQDAEKQLYGYQVVIGELRKILAGLETSPNE